MTGNKPNRIVSLVPSKTELLFDLGLEKEIIGVTKFCIHPADKVKSIQKIGGTKNLNLERIAALNPDLIIANKEENTKEQIQWLCERFPVYISDILNVDDALRMIEHVGDLTQSEEKARKLVEEIRHERNVYRVASGSAGTACYLIWNDPLMGAAADTYIHAMLQEGGWQNVLEDDFTRYPVLEISDIIAAEPQFVFLSSEPFPFKDKHLSQWKELIPNATIQLVDGEMFSWYGSRMKKAFAYFDVIRYQSP